MLKGKARQKPLKKFTKDLQNNKKLNIVDKFFVMSNIFDMYSSSLSFLEIKLNETIDLLSLKFKVI